MKTVNNSVKGGTEYIDVTLPANREVTSSIPSGKMPIAAVPLTDASSSANASYFAVVTRYKNSRWFVLLYDTNLTVLSSLTDVQIRIELCDA